MKLLLIFFILCIGISQLVSSEGDSNVEVKEKNGHQAASPAPIASPPLGAPNTLVAQENETALTGSGTSNGTTSNDTVSTNSGAKTNETKTKDGEQSGDKKDEQQTPGTEVDETEEKKVHCCRTKVYACLSSPGDASNEMLSLVIKSRDKVKVEIITPGFLTADPATFTTENGKDVSVRIEMVDAEAAKQQTSSTIKIKSEGESCEIPVPSKNLGYNEDKNGFSYSTLRTPVIEFSMLAAALVLVLGSWAYCRYRVRKARHGETADGARYVELEMGLNNSGTNSVNQNSAETDDNWDQGWEDDWDDSGSSQFKLTNSLSAKGLASRRTAKGAD